MKTTDSSGVTGDGLDVLAGKVQVGTADSTQCIGCSDDFVSPAT